MAHNPGDLLQQDSVGLFDLGEPVLNDHFAFAIVN